MIRFSSPVPVGNEHKYVAEAIDNRVLAGVGPFARRCEAWLEKQLAAKRVILTGSCTDALELAALLLDIAPGDEVILPSFTFCTTASAFALRGAKLVFADVEPTTLCMTAAEVRPLVTARTRAVVAVHYAGYGGALPGLLALCEEHGIPLVEDAAQALMASQDGQPLGTHGVLGCISFHDTKNMTAGEGGALVINDPDLIQRAEILRDKGTDRAQFFRGQVDKYTWQGLGSSFVPSELATAYLLAQLEQAEAITARRKHIAERYRAGLAPHAAAGRATLPGPALLQATPGHMFWMLLPDHARQQAFIAHLKAHDISAVHHYVPLHSSPGGLRFGVAPRPLPVTEDIWSRLVRLPLHMDLGDADVDKVIAAAGAFLSA